MIHLRKRVLHPSRPLRRVGWHNCQFASVGFSFRWFSHSDSIPRLRRRHCGVSCSPTLSQSTRKDGAPNSAVGKGWATRPQNFCRCPWPVVMVPTLRAIDAQRWGNHFMGWSRVGHPPCYATYLLDALERSEGRYRIRSVTDIPAIADSPRFALSISTGPSGCTFPDEMSQRVYA